MAEVLSRVAINLCEQLRVDIMNIKSLISFASYQMVFLQITCPADAPRPAAGDGHCGKASPKLLTKSADKSDTYLC